MDLSWSSVLKMDTTKKYQSRQKKQSISRIITLPRKNDTKQYKIKKKKKPVWAIPGRLTLPKFSRNTFTQTNLSPKTIVRKNGTTNEFSPEKFLMRRTYHAYKESLKEETCSEIKSSLSTIQKYPKVVNNFLKRPTFLFERYQRLNRLLVFLYKSRVDYFCVYADKLYPIKVPLKEQEKVLEDINNEAIPYSIMYELSQVPLMHDCYIICEVQDLRRNNPRINFVLLKPTKMCIIGDPESYQDGKQITDEERLQNEAIYSLNNSEPLCLDPNPEVAKVSILMDYYRRPFAGLVRKFARKAALKRKHKPLKLNFQLFDSSVAGEYFANTTEFLPCAREDYDKAALMIHRHGMSVPRSKLTGICPPLKVKTYVYKFNRIFKLQVFLTPHNEQYTIKFFVDPTKTDGVRLSYFLGNKVCYLDKYIAQLTDIIASDYFKCQSYSAVVASTGVTRYGKPYAILNVTKGGKQIGTSVNTVTASLEIECPSINNLIKSNMPSFLTYLKKALEKEEEEAAA